MKTQLTEPKGHTPNYWADGKILLKSGVGRIAEFASTHEAREVAESLSHSAALPQAIQALWGLKQAIRTIYLAGHITDDHYPTFRMEAADKIVSAYEIALQTAQQSVPSAQK